jgi:ATP-dependent Lon protease
MIDESDHSEVDPGPPSELVVARDAYPDKLPIMALPSRPVFPKVMVPVALESEDLQRMIKDVTQSGKRLVGLVLEREDTEPDEDGIVEGEVYDVGVVAEVINVSSSDGEMTAVLSALDRMRIVRVLSHVPYLVAEVEYLKDKGAPTDELKAYTLAVINSIKDLVSQNPLYKEQLSLLLSEGDLDEPGLLADMAAFLTSAEPAALQDVLETLDVRRRLEKVLGLLKRELEIARLQTKIRDRIEERINEQQREFFLREQLKAIKQELGLEKEGKETEIEEFMARLEEREPTEEAASRITDEMNKLKMLDNSSSEYAMTRNYLDWLTVLPWGVVSKTDVDLETARQGLDRDHYGLSDVKERIIEFIAEGILRGDFGGSIICLVGPPGVGKTSIGRSIANCLGREFYRFSLGGMRDEAEIKGHRRTYIGAMPGKFLQALRVCEKQNPLIMLDEIDKIHASYHGDPAAALLEVLDPEQNREFLDHYLDVRFDLSKVLFVCTANRLDTIPPPLLDRMEVIQLSGYMLEEKLEIASRYLLPKALKNLKQKRGRIAISRAAMRALIDGYAREAGLRNLENQIKKIVRKCAVRIVEGATERMVIGPNDIEELLGQPMFSNDALYDKPRPGVVMGLAWTSMGGDTLFIEAKGVLAKGPGFRQTGQLGEVMVESSEIAYTFVRALCREEGSSYFDERFVHLHVPAGAVPKDGPSAGITMATALYTLALDIAPRAHQAMTGELNLSGMVMPVGGIKEKLIAAKRAGATSVLLPKANQPDFEQLPDSIKKGQKIHFVATFDEVIELCMDRPKKKPIARHGSTKKVGRKGPARNR